MKKLFLVLALILACGYSNAQRFRVKDLIRSVGRWEGKLTYLDYSTGNPFTMLANIKIGLTGDKKGYVMAYEYPKEPHANSKDTTYIVNNLFGNERIVDFKKGSDGGFKMVTEKDGVDGNDNKRAILKHIYLLQSNTYSISKEVKFEGTDVWIKRNEYLFNRIDK